MEEVRVLRLDKQKENTVDKYDIEIQQISAAVHTKHEIDARWSTATPEDYGCLFQRTTPDGKMSDVLEDGKYLGCLTQIKSCPAIYRASTPELTAEILDDPNLPSRPQDITLEHLPHFAAYQRRLDAMYPNRGK